MLFCWIDLSIEQCLNGDSRIIICLNDGVEGVLETIFFVLECILFF